MEFKPQIHTFMESWYFAQRSEPQRLERDDGGLIAERKHANALLDKLMQLRKSQFLLWAATPKEPSLHGFRPPREIGFQGEWKKAVFKTQEQAQRTWQQTTPSIALGVV